MAQYLCSSTRAKFQYEISRYSYSDSIVWNMKRNGLYNVRLYKEMSPLKLESRISVK